MSKIQKETWDVLRDEYNKRQAVTDILYAVDIMDDIIGLPFMIDMPKTGFLLATVITDLQSRLQLSDQE